MMLSSRFESLRLQRLATRSGPRRGAADGGRLPAIAGDGGQRLGRLQLQAAAGGRTPHERPELRALLHRAGPSLSGVLRQ